MKKIIMSYIRIKNRNKFLIYLISPLDLLVDEGEIPFI